MDYAVPASSSTSPRTGKKSLLAYPNTDNNMIEDEKKEDWRTIPLTAHTTTPHRRHAHHQQASPPELHDASFYKSNIMNSPVSPRHTLYMNNGSPSPPPPPAKLRFLPSPSSSHHSGPSTKFVIRMCLAIAIASSMATYFYLATFVMVPPPEESGETGVLPTEPRMTTLQKRISHLRDVNSEPRQEASRKFSTGPRLQLVQSRAKDLQNAPRVVTMNVEKEVVVEHHWKLSSSTALFFQLPHLEIGRDEEDEEGVAVIPAAINTTTTDSMGSPIMKITSTDEAEDKTDMASSESGDTCEAAEAWQEESHPNCNSIHELDLMPQAQFLGQGWFRMTWLYEGVVLKMLRLEREYLDEYYELHRRDAVAMDHLTFSPYVMNVYGYCGQSAVNELADFKPGINALEQLDRRLRGQHTDGVLMLKLRLALSISVGLYHVHYGIPGMPWEHGNITATRRATMAHYDINPRNIAIVGHGQPKLNDFNIAEFLRYPRRNETTCGFPSRLHEPWWRAPEEMNVNSTDTMVDEKVDIFALGAVLFHILTTHSPRGKMKKERMEGVRMEVQAGVLPSLMEPFASDPSPIVQAFRDAMALCLHMDPKQRGTAGEVATILYRALDQVPDLQESANVEPPTKEKKHDKTKKKTTHHHTHAGK